jgi:ribosomal protein L11 methyltransferase
MKRLIESPGFLKKKWFILSGLLRNQAKMIEQKLNRMKMSSLTKWEQDGIWYTFHGKFNSS